MTLSRKPARKLAGLALLAATGLFLAACGTDSVVDGRGGGAGPTASATAGSGTAPSASVIPRDSASASVIPRDSAGAGSDGTFTGRLTYLAPGKLLVGERAFWVAEDTEIIGGDICGDPETVAAEKCTSDDLDGAAKDGNLTVEVTIKEGVAGQVHEV
jgi:hypothetical protein